MNTVSTGVGSDALQYYTCHAAADMFGHHLSDLWTHVIPQRCHSEPVVRHAVISLSSIHFDFVTATRLGASGPLEEPSVRSVRLYVIALGVLRDYMETEAVMSKANILFSCAALLGFNLIRGERNEAIRHLDNGAAIIRAWAIELKYAQRGGCHDDFQKLYDAFSALDIQATAYDEERLPALGQLYIQRFTYTPIPPVFVNAWQAQQILTQLIGCAFTDLIENAVYKAHSRDHVPESIFLWRQYICHAFKRWSLAMEQHDSDLLPADEYRRKDVRSWNTFRILQAMRLQHRTLELLLNEGSWGLNLGLSFDSQATELLNLAECVLPASADGLNRSFGFDLGVGPPLFLLALKTSKSSIRTRAAALINRVHRVEGWYSPSFMNEALNQLLVQQQHLEAELHGSCEGLSHLICCKLEEVAEMNIILNGSSNIGMERILANHI